MGKEKKVKDVVVEETVTEEIKVEREVEEIEKTEKDKKAEIKKARKEKRKGEFKAFFILVLIIGILVALCWYWYNYIYDADKGDKNNNINQQENNNVNQNINYEVVSYESSEYLDIVGNKYIVEIKNNKIVKVTSMDTTVLFEGNLEYTGVYVDSNGELFTYLDEYSEYGNNLTVYKLTDGEFKEEINLKTNSVFYSPLVYNGNEKVLLGFVGYSSSNDAIDEDYEIKNSVYILGNEEVTLDNYYIVGDDARLSIDSEIYTDSKRYVIVEGIDENDQKYGLYDLENNELIIELSYDRLYKNTGDTYIAIKDSKAGVIDINLKKIVDYEYDFIDAHNGYYIVSKNNKMAIMNSDYTLLTDFVFDYQPSDLEIKYSYILCCASFNTFETFKIKDKIVLVTNVNELEYGGIKYDNHNAYIISSDGSYTTIEQNMFDYDAVTGLIYTYDKGTKNYKIYDDTLKEMYSIDISDYDFDYVPVLELINKNTIMLDGSSSLYYDYSTGKEIKEQNEFVYDYGTTKIQYQPSNKILNITIGENNKEFSIKNFRIDKDFYELDEQNFYILNSDSKKTIYISLKKSE